MEGGVRKGGEGIEGVGGNEVGGWGWEAAEYGALSKVSTQKQPALNNTEANP